MRSPSRPAAGFGYPVVPEGGARIRIQASAALAAADLEAAVDAIAAVVAELGPHPECPERRDTAGDGR